jgi:ABC-type molybdate transport system ATPase subunit
MTEVRANCTFVRDALTLRLDFSLQPGITWLRGASGTGKTTLLRLIAGLEMPSEGAILIDNAALGAAQSRRAPLVFQMPKLFPHLSVYENLRVGHARNAEPAELERITQALGLVPLFSRNAKHVSGGEAQRVAVARALLSQPRVLLLDEPFSAQSPENAGLLLTAIMREAAKLPVLVTAHHEPVPGAFDLGKTLILSDGTIK